MSTARSLSEISTRSQIDIPITGDYASLETGGLTLGYTGSSVSASLSPAAMAGAVAPAASPGPHRGFHAAERDVQLAGAALPAGFNATLGGAWQLSNRLLLPGDQLFQVGGPTTVRGYPSSAVAGLDGYYANLELHRATPILDTSLDVYAFYDRGAVYNTFPTVQILSSAGAGLAWTLNKYLVAVVSAGSFPSTKSSSICEAAISIYSGSRRKNSNATIRHGSPPDPVARNIGSLRHDDEVERQSSPG